MTPRPDHPAGRPAKRPGEGRHLVVGVSGASGIPYTQALLRALTERTAYAIHLVFSPAASVVVEREAGMSLSGGMVDAGAFSGVAVAEGRIVQYPPRDIGARLASGSFLHDGMVICPASMKTIGALAAGYADNLLTRAADVTLKERRKLVLVPRETPLSLIHLRAMTALAEAGAVILPAMPGFYHRPETLSDLVAFLVMKIFDQLGIPYESPFRWNPAATGKPRRKPPR